MNESKKMFTMYTQKQTPAQKKDAPSASSVFDASSQSESLQRKAELANGAVQRVEPPRPNNTGMPDNLKAGIESLSGFSMDDVRVHYNSSKPATVQALAYTQGTDIHVAPGQEKHLPHEAWHVAQQMAGRVSPTTNINGMPVNDNAALEHEADVMGEKAVQCKGEVKFVKNKAAHVGCIAAQCVFRQAGPIPKLLNMESPFIEGGVETLNDYLTDFIDRGIDDIAPKKNVERWPWRLDNQNRGGNYQIQLNDYVNGSPGAEGECGVTDRYHGGTTIAAVYCDKMETVADFKQALRDSRDDKHVYTDQDTAEVETKTTKPKASKKQKFLARLAKKAGKH